MIPKGLFTQIGMLILSVVIIVTYVQPAFTKIGIVQDNIKNYIEERQKVESVNVKLTDLLNRISNVSNTDRSKLLRYLPDSVDEIAVQRDLVIVSNEAGVKYKDVNFVGVEEIKNNRDLEASANLPRAYTFSLSVEGSYEQIKNLFLLMEQNNYPLEVQGLGIKKSKEGFLMAEIQLATYSYKEPISNIK